MSFEGGVGCRRWLKTPLTGRLIHINCPQGCQRSIASGSGQSGGKWQLGGKRSAGSFTPSLHAGTCILRNLDASRSIVTI